MKKVTVSGREYVLLEPDEINCEHGEWTQAYKSTRVNPNDEFVEGFGCDPFYVTVKDGRQCAFCGYIERTQNRDQPDGTVVRR